jgi:hypothetical protein
MANAKKYNYVGWDMHDGEICECGYYENEREVKMDCQYYIKVEIPSSSSSGAKLVGEVPLQK